MRSEDGANAFVATVVEDEGISAAGDPRPHSGGPGVVSPLLFLSGLKFSTCQPWRNTEAEGEVPGLFYFQQHQRSDKRFYEDTRLEKKRHPVI